MHQIVSDTMKGMTILLMNGLGAFKYRQEDDVSDRPRRQPWMAAENEFNDRMIIPETFWFTDIFRNHSSIQDLFKA